jgi:hypothetical protein
VTPEMTPAGRERQKISPLRMETYGIEGMVYTLDDNQLLSLWTVISQLGVIREMRDPTDRSILLTKAQALLTALVLELSPLLRDRNNSTASGPRPKELTRFDA